jgi:ATP-dependent DNA helicase UvrD/PcrA
MPPVVSPDQLPFFEELAAAPPRLRRPHLRIQPPLLADLTARQRRAVTHADGPLLIVAGAGTGKTTVITRRIAWLIAEKKALPSQILALTFTDRAAAEMVERADISTFHAFGDRLLREHALEAGLSDRSTVLGRAEQIILLREHLFELPLDRYRPLGDPTRFLSALVTLIARLRDEDIGPDAYLRAAAALKERAEKSPLDGVLADEAARHGELANAYAAYERIMRTTDRIDFGDQVTLALRLLRDNPGVLATEQERYRYILVDEFQDTNHAQWEMVRLLAEPHGNVTVVGDDDQSIYRFRGAALGNILGFRTAYPHAASAVLVDNFRSRQPILDAAHRLIRHNDPDRLEAREGLDKRLKARLRFTSPEPTGGPIGLIGFATGSDEADAVADRIGASMRSGRRAGDHAILVRGNRDADPYLRALNMARIPSRFSGTAGLYRQPEVRVLISFLRAVNDPDDSVSLYDLATSEIFGLAASDVTLALTNARRRRSSLAVALADAVAEPERSPFGLRAIETVQRLLGSLEAHRAMSTEKSSGELLYHFITSSGWLGRLAHEARETGEERLANVGRFFEIVRRQGSLLRDDRLPFLVAQLDTLIETGDDPSTADVDPEQGDAVHVLTYHKAKGLEFGVVFMVGLVDDRIPGRDRRDGLDPPDELLHDPVTDADQHAAEERRLFYVGMTRAREELVLSWAQDYGGRRSRAVSRFVSEALDLPPATPLEAVEPTTMERLARHEASPVTPTAPQRPSFADRPLTLSYGQISDYLDCPARYRYAHVVRIPTPASHQMVYGKALHAAVQAFHRRQLAGKPMTDVDELHAALDASWESVGFLTRQHEEARRAAAHEVVARFWAEQQRDPARPIAVEREFTVGLGRDRLRGRYDRVDRDDEGRVVVTDYKSSDVRDLGTANRKARESLQLSIYALAHEAETGALPDELALHFLESGLVGRAEPTEKRLGKAQEQLATVADGIRAGRFAATPSGMRCGYCPFREICPDASR